jgi:TetR/AcrR family transcriptional regulator
MKGPSASRRRKRRGVGRPDSQTDAKVSDALLAAARELFLKHGFEKTTARQIAQEAHTTPAMIHYYFGDKAGLFHAMLDQTIAPLRALLAEGISNDAAQIDSSTLMSLQMRLVAANPWIPTVIVNEVLAQPGRLRPTFIRDVAGRHLPLLMKLFEQGQRSGKLRRELDPKLAALSFISLCMFPFIARAVVEPVFGVRLDPLGVEQLIQHTTELFMCAIERDEHR